MKTISAILLSINTKIISYCLSKIIVCNAIHLNSLHYTLKWITWNYDNDDYSRVQNMRSQMPNAHLMISFVSLYLHYFYYIFSFARVITRVYVMQRQRCGTHSDIFCLCVFLSCIISSFRKEWKILQLRYGFRLRQLSSNWSKDSKGAF